MDGRSGRRLGPREVTRIGGASGILAERDVRDFVRGALDSVDLAMRSVCVVVPDATRTCPVPMLPSAIHDALRGRVARITVLVALGTRAAMAERDRAAHVGHRPGAAEVTYPGTTILDHARWDPAACVDLGTIPAARRPGGPAARRPGGPSSRAACFVAIRRCA